MVMYFNLYLVWKFTDGSLYTLAKIPWYVGFWADTNMPGSGVSRIRITDGIQADEFVRTHANPEKLNGPTSNEANNWEPA